VGLGNLGVKGRNEARKNFRNKVIVEVNFISAAHFSQKAGKNENNNNLINKLLYNSREPV
jgi:hypothetical protein